MDLNKLWGHVGDVNIVKEGRKGFVEDDGEMMGTFNTPGTSGDIYYPGEI